MALAAGGETSLSRRVLGPQTAQYEDGSNLKTHTREFFCHRFPLAYLPPTSDDEPFASDSRVQRGPQPSSSSMTALVSTIPRNGGVFPLQMDRDARNERFNVNNGDHERTLQSVRLGCHSHRNHLCVYVLFLFS